MSGKKRTKVLSGAHRADRPANWGSVNQITGELENKKGHGKHIGAIDEKDSLISMENGFKNIIQISGSPLSYIERELDNK